MHLGVTRHLLGTLTEGTQFLSSRRIYFDIPRTHLMLIAHDEQENGSIQSLSFVKLEFSYREILWIAFWAFWDLAILVADDPDIRSAITHHLERGIDEIYTGLCRVVFHRDISQTLGFDGPDQCRPVLT
jgi:hypothetical protein